ncbi:MAG: DUF1599 domain-containing protein [Crocinitomicaceae bacterium]|nr:DUF1599 domain-containing protein [Crocinitomicaceae bacterium]
MIQTSAQYTKVISACREIFSKKTKDYGTAWRILRPSSLTDQLFIKAQRIRTIQETGVNQVGEGVEDEFRAIVNYCVMALIQLEHGSDLPMEMEPEQAMNLYQNYTQQAQELMERKNHDYGEAWRDMRVSSLTDLILMKILRVKQIEDNAGKTIMSEGIDANYFDMLNYSVFALIHLTDNTKL